MSRPAAQDRRKSSKQGKSKKVGLARIQVETDPKSGYSMATCSCGRDKFHSRLKVVEDWADKHVNDKHGGRALWF